MGELGPPDWPKTLGKMAARLDALLDGVRRHEATDASLSSATPSGGDGGATAILRQPPAAELKLVAAARAEVEAADADSAPVDADVRQWVASYHAWAERLRSTS